jgi:serine/threonine-protein kinase
MLETGRELAGYRIERLLGEGGMGVVYEAVQVVLDRPVALKILSPAFSGDDAFRERFRREATLQAALDHPNVVPVYEAGESEDGLYLAMRLIRGSDLKRLSEHGDLAPERALALLAQAADALDAAHAAGVVHRDVKPQNILVDEEDRAFLADFGLTKTASDRKATRSGRYTGSLDYAAPEIIRGEPAGPAADLYAFAAVLAEVLTGVVPFPVDSEAALLYAHLQGEPPRPSERRPELPAGLDQVVARGLAKRPEERYRTAGELVADARRALASQPVSGNGRRSFSETVVDAPLLRTAPVIAVAPPRERRWAPIALFLVVLVALGVGAFAVGRVSHDSGTPKQAVAQAGPLELTFPSEAWRAVKPPAIPGLALESAVALRSTDPAHPGTVVAGIAPQAEGAAMMPATLETQLTGPAPARTVRVGTLAALDYPSVPAGKVPWRLSLLLVPTARGAATVACLVPRVLVAGSTPADCDAVAATLRLHGLRAQPLGQTAGYASEVSSALTLLDGERLAARRQLDGATTPAEEARAAAALQSAFAGAARRIAALPASPVARPTAEKLVAKLRATASQYAALAAAARTHTGGAYQRAAARVDGDERAVDAAADALAAVKAG